MIAKPETNIVRRALKAGAIAGLSAGGLLTLMMTIMSLARGNDVWFGIKGAAAPFLGERAMQPGFDAFAVWAGLVAHLAVSVAWAIPFAFLVYGLGRGITMAAGVAWGFVVWLGMFYMVLPIVGLSKMVEEAPVVRSIVYHVFFSVVMAGAFLLAQKLEAKRDIRLWQYRHRFAHA